MTTDAEAPGGLRRRAATGVRATSVATGVGAVVGFAQIAVLAHLLEPTDFGLVAAVNVAIGLMRVVTDLGLSGAVIARRTEDPRVLSSLLGLNVVAGVATFAGLVALAPVVAGIFGEPEITGLVRWAALGFLFACLGQHFGPLLERDLRFRLLARIDIVSRLAGAGLAIGAAIAGAGAVSLVWGMVLATAIRSLAIAAAGWPRWRPTLRLRLEETRGYLSFGIYQIGARMLNYGATNVDYLLVGTFLGAEALGLYFIAYELVVKPLMLFNPALTRVAFPIFASRQDDPAAITRGFLELVRLVGLVVIPALAVLAVLAEHVIPVVYGGGWEQSVPLVQVLAVVGAARALGNPVGAVLLARDRPDTVFRLNLLYTVLLALSLRVAVEFGLLAVAWTYFGVTLLTVFWWPLLLRGPIGLQPLRFFVAIGGPVAYAAAAAVAAGAVAVALGDGAADVVVIALGGCAGVAAYAGLLALRERDYVRELWGLATARS